MMLRWFSCSVLFIACSDGLMETPLLSDGGGPEGAREVATAQPPVDQGLKEDRAWVRLFDAATRPDDAATRLDDAAPPLPDAALMPEDASPPPEGPPFDPERSPSTLS